VPTDENSQITDEIRCKALVIALLNQSKEELKQADAAITAAIDLRTSAMYKLDLAEELARMYAERYDTGPESW
jgi:hypothetical protein